jgi:uncharacterized protein YkwD
MRARIILAALGALGLSAIGASGFDRRWQPKPPVAPPVVAAGSESEKVPSGPSEITPGSVVSALNAARAEHGLPLLHEDPQLDAVASDRMKEMEDLEYWDHVGPGRREPFDWYETHDYKFASAGENLARGFESTELLLEAWMESKGHRDNILSPRFRDCGVAVIDGSTLGPAPGRSVVLVFGSRLAP